MKIWLKFAPGATKSPNFFAITSGKVYLWLWKTLENSGIFFSYFVVTLKKVTPVTIRIKEATDRLRYTWQLAINMCLSVCVCVCSWCNCVTVYMTSMLNGSFFRTLFLPKCRLLFLHKLPTVQTRFCSWRMCDVVELVHGSWYVRQDAASRRLQNQLRRLARSHQRGAVDARRESSSRAICR